MPANVHAQLGALLTGTEARQLADRLAVGDTVTRALTVVAAARRRQVAELLHSTGLIAADRAVAIAFLRGIQGAHAHPTAITPVWTAPANLAQHGQLTASIEHFVMAARESVICSTFNFQRTSVLWSALREVASRVEVDVRVYLDTDAADEHPESWNPTTAQVAAELSGATVLRTRSFHGKKVRSHAKFVAIDHQYLIVTSANFSRSAEQFNVEMGLQLENRLVTQAVEHQMLAMEAHLYEVVQVPAGHRFRG